MAHEIMEHDVVGSRKLPTWHKLENIYDQELTPIQAVQRFEMDYDVQPWTLTATSPDGSQTISVKEAVYNVRDDVGFPLGIVSSDYVAFQNMQMAEFAEALVEADKGIKVETIGSIRNGAKVWMLLRGDVFGIANGDDIYPYIALTNGHTAKDAFRITPTTVRIVCSNTMHMVVPRDETGELQKSALRITHTGDLMKRVEEAKKALKFYHQRKDSFATVANASSKVAVDSKQLQQFFLDAYAVAYEEIPLNPQTKKEENARQRAMGAFRSFEKRFDDEKEIAGASAWNAFNAMSGVIQHDKKGRGKDDEDRVMMRMASNQFGLNQRRTKKVFELMLKTMVV